MKYLLPVCIAILLGTMACAAPAPALIPFQGRLTDQKGVPYTNGQFTLIFNLYDEPVGGNVKWTETHQKVGVINGMVNVFLGSINAALGNEDFSQTRYLGITVDADNNPNNPDPEMVPRQMIISAIYSREAGNSVQLAGSDWSAVMSGTNPAIASLRADKLPIAGIQSQHIAPRAVSSAKLDDHSVGTNHLAASVLNQLIPVGTILPFAGDISPVGWLPCDGRVVSRSDYANLFEVIGLTWGVGDSLATFGLPDLRGRMVVGAGTSAIRDRADRNLSPRVLGKYDGEEVHLLTKDEMPIHSHTMNPDTAIAVNLGRGLFGSNGGGDNKTLNYSTGIAGGDREHNVMNPLAVVNYIIKY